MRSSRLHARSGFTITELMLVVALIGLLVAVITPLLTNALRRENLNAIATEFAGWLEEVSLQPERTGTACQVTLTPGRTIATNGTIASVEPTTCDPAGSGTFRFPASGGNRPISVTVTFRNFAFTPRGAITRTANVDVRIRHANETPPAITRCVRVSAFLGLIQVGRDDSGSTGCQYFTGGPPI